MRATSPSTPFAPPPPGSTPSPRARRSSASTRSATAPRDLPEARGLPADRLVQDPRRDQRHRAAAAGGSWPTASGPSAPATPRRASRWPRARPARRASVLVMDTRAGDQARRHRAARRDDRQGALRRVLARGRDRTSRIACTAGSCIRSTTTTSSAATARPALEILEDLPDVDAVIAPIGGGGLLAGIGVASCARCSPEARVYARRAGDRGAAARRRSRPGAPARFENWTASFVDGAGGQSVLPSMWPLSRRSRSTTRSSSRSTTPRAAMKLVGRALPRHRRRRGGAAPSPPRCRRACAAAGHKKIVAVVSGGNIDLSRFASLAGACS